MNIIDAFIVSIGLDPSDYERGASDVARAGAALKDKTLKDANDVEKSQGKSGTEFKKQQREKIEGNKKVSDSFDGVKREALAMLAVLVGANSIKDFVAKSVTGFTTMQHAAQQAGLSVQDLAAFGSMIEANGGQADSARASISALSATLEAARTGLQPLSGPMLMGMNQIGAGLEDDPLSVYQKFAAWAEGKDPRLAAQTGRALGFDQASIDLAIKGAAAVSAAFAQARENLPTPADVEKVRALQAAFADLSQDIKGFALGLLTDAAPALVRIIELVDGVLKRVKGLRNDAQNNPQAYEQRERAFTQRGVMFPGLMAFFTGDSNAPSPSQSAARQSGSAQHPRVRQAKRYFESQGFTPTQAAGIVGVLMNESGATLDPTATNEIGAIGIMQALTPSRQRALLKGRRSINQVPFEEQLGFVMQEFRTTERDAYNRIKAARTYGDAALGMTAYERPHNRGTTAYNRYVGRATANAVNVGSIIINTPTTNPREHAREIQRHLPHVAGANSGIPN